jgi:hypothetical protein
MQKIERTYWNLTEIPVTRWSSIIFLTVHVAPVYDLKTQRSCQVQIMSIAQRKEIKKPILVYTVLYRTATDFITRSRVFYPICQSEDKHNGPSLLSSQGTKLYTIMSHSVSCVVQAREFNPI